MATQLMTYFKTQKSSTLSMLYIVAILFGLIIQISLTGKKLKQPGYVSEYGPELVLLSIFISTRSTLRDLDFCLNRSAQNQKLQKTHVNIYANQKLATEL